MPWSKADARVAAAASLPESDLGLAERFALWFGPTWRYRPGHGWMHYDGRRWALDAHGQTAVAHMLQVVRAVTELEPARLGREGSELRAAAARDRRRRWATSCETPRHLDAALRLAQALPGMLIEGHRWDADPYALNTLSGVLDLRSGDLTPARPEHLCTGLVDADVDPSARSTALDAVLAHLTGGDPAVRAFLARWFGYCLTASMACEVFTFTYGAASSGKTTLLSAFTSMMGSYADTASPDDFSARRAVGGPTPEIMRLIGKRFIYIPEAGGLRMDVSRVKQIVGGDPLVARFLHQNPVTFHPVCKLAFTANELAVVPDDDPGLRRRLLPLRVPSPVTRADARIKHDLEHTPEGRAALLAFAARGAAKWIAAGADLAALAVPGTVTAGVQDYLEQMDPLAEWWDERVHERPDARTLTSALHADYSLWAREHAVARPLGMKSFAQRLTARGFPVDADRTHGSLRRGLAIRGAFV